MILFDPKTPSSDLPSDLSSFGNAAQGALAGTLTAPYAAILVCGDDAATFLQGQLTSNVNELTPGTCQSGALCNPKGRVIAQFVVAQTGPADYALLLPAPLIDAVTTTLTRYVLRAKVTISADIDATTLCLTQVAQPLADGTCTSGDTFACRPPWLRGTEAHWALTQADHAASDPTALSWSHAHVLLGIAPPSHTAEPEYLPQMLNLDAFDGISMTKGCYTGQEIIARVHHRGSVKRRLRRFIAKEGLSIQSGDTVTTTNGTVAGTVVETALDSAGSAGILAVIKQSSFSDGKPGEPSTLSCGPVPLSHWPLPYAI